ncbi:MAG: hypothetical protein P8Z70_05300 [Desulfuromonadales bacterium]|jgi:hypothetical protein
MGDFIHGNVGSFSLLIGFMAFLYTASRFNHKKMNQVKDRDVVILCLVVSVLIGMVVALFVNIFCRIAFI